MADATATYLGNMVRNREDIEKAIEEGKRISGVEGIVIVLDDVLGAWGDYELVKL